MIYRTITSTLLFGILATLQPAQASDSSDMPWLSSDNCLNATTSADNGYCWVSTAPLYYGTAYYDTALDVTVLTSEGEVEDYVYRDLGLQDVVGRSVLLISFTQAESVSSTITGLPYLYGYQMTDSTHIEEYLHSQATLFNGAAGQWDVSYGVYPIESSTVTRLRYFFMQASYAGTTYDGSAALFKHPGIYLVDTDAEAEDIIAYYMDELAEMNSNVPDDVQLGTVTKNPWNKTITLNWINPTDTDFDHVTILRTDRFGTETTLTETETGTSYTDSSISYGMTYMYTISTVDTTGNMSAGVTTDPKRVRRPAVHHLRVHARDTAIVARWERLPLRLNPAVGYIVYYGTSPNDLTTSIDVGNTTTVTIPELTFGQRYYVAVAAYNGDGVEGPLSIVKSIQL